MTKFSLVLVTGGTGFVGSEVIEQLLADGYNVRAVARTPKKADTLKSTYPDARGKLEVIVMADLISDAGEWPSILEGVDAIIHVAAPVLVGSNGTTTSEQIYSVGVKGTQKLLDALENSSVKRFVFTSSIGALLKRDDIMDRTVYSHNTWSDVDDNTNLENNAPLYTYIASKAISEKLVWKAADKYPHIDFTTILPSTIYGKFVKNYPTPTNILELHSNRLLYYELMRKRSEVPTWKIASFVHNKDVARAHVLALGALILPKGQKKRLVVSAGSMTWTEATEFLKTPEVVGKFKERGLDIITRLPDISSAEMQSQFGLDTSLTESVLGLKKDDYISWKEILLEVIPYLFDWEREHPDAL